MRINMKILIKFSRLNICTEHRNMLQKNKRHWFFICATLWCTTNCIGLSDSAKASCGKRCQCKRRKRSHRRVERMLQLIETTQITDAFADRENSQRMLTLEKSKAPAEWIFNWLGQNKYFCFWLERRELQVCAKADYITRNIFNTEVVVSCRINGLPPLQSFDPCLHVINYAFQWGSFPTWWRFWRCTASLFVHHNITLEYQVKTENKKIMLIV